MLNKMGISYRKGLMIIENCNSKESWAGSLETFLLPPLNMNAAFTQLKYRKADNHLLKMWDGCEKYYLRSIARLTQLNTILSISPSKDLGPPSIERFRGSTAHLMARLMDTLCSSIICLSQIWLYLHACPSDPPSESECLRIVKLPNVSSSEEHDSHLSNSVLGDEHWQSATNDIRLFIASLTQLKSDIERMKITSNFPVSPIHWAVFLKASDNLEIYVDRLKKMRTMLFGQFSSGSVLPCAAESLDWLANEMTSLSSTIKCENERISQSVESDTVVLEEKCCRTNQHTQLENHAESLLKRVLLIFQSFFKKYCAIKIMEKEDEKREDAEAGVQENAAEMENDAEEIQDGHLSDKINASITSDVEILQLGGITSELKELIQDLSILMDEDSQNPESLNCKRMVLSCLPALDQLSLLAQFVVTQLTVSYRTTSKLLSVLLALFSDLATRGFCIPRGLDDAEEGKEDGPGGRDGKWEESEGMGLGDAEDGDEKAKEASDKLESEDQLEGAHQQGKEKEEKADKDLKEEETGVEMSEDFEGKLQDLGEKEEEGDEESESGDDDDDAEKQMGKTGSEAEKLDEQIWGSDDSEDEEDGEEMGSDGEEDQSKGKGEQPELRAKDQNLGKAEGEEEEGEGKEDKKKNKPDINEMEDKGEIDDDQVDPYHGNQEPLPEPEALDLPDDLQLDDGEAKDKEGGDEENPFDIDKMKEISLSRTWMVLSCLPALDQLSLLAQFVVTQLTVSYRTTSKLLSVLLALFSDLATRGFCIPRGLDDAEEGKEDGPGGRDGKWEESEGMGLGDAEDGDEKAKEASDKLESEDQLEGAHQQGKEKEEKADKDLKDLLKNLHVKLVGDGNEDHEDEASQQEEEKVAEEPEGDEGEGEDEEEGPNVDGLKQDKSEEMEIDEEGKEEEDEHDRGEGRRDEEEPEMKEDENGDEDEKVEEKQEEEEAKPSDDRPSIVPVESASDAPKEGSKDKTDSTQEELNMEEGKNEEESAEKHGVGLAQEEQKKQGHGGETEDASVKREQSLKEEVEKEEKKRRRKPGELDSKRTLGKYWAYIVHQFMLTESNKFIYWFIGEVKEPLKKKLKTVETESKKEGSEEESKKESVEEEKEQKSGEENEMYEHIKEAKQRSEAQTLDAATEDQAKLQPTPNLEEEEADKNIDEEEDLAMQEDYKAKCLDLIDNEEIECVPRDPTPAYQRKIREALRQVTNINNIVVDEENPPVQKSEEMEGSENEKRNKAKREDDQKGEGRAEGKAEVEGEVVPTANVQRGAESSFHTLPSAFDHKLEVSMENPEELRKKLEQQLAEWSQPPAGDEALSTWENFVVLTESLSRDLSEQLRLVLEPTHASRLRGDYRTGRRINMRKVIPYIASQFRKDKIWLRRTKPSKREYQIVLAIDDSSSMADNHSKELAFESLALVSRALTLLEAGQLAVVSFGESVKVLHPLHEPFSEHSGARLLQQFSFDQKKTLMGNLMETATSMLCGSKSSCSPGVGVAQLMVIVSDGRGVWNEGSDKVKNAVRRAQDAGIFTDSIMDIRMPIFKDGKMLGISSYLDNFPFPFYLILRNINALPGVLSDALRQWFELVTEMDKQ
ncbi:hypothetical protein J437_LFUL012701 [Ladona fulva]|uniref:VWFA domain-containing protein n=1 Tax=Ladona fulva TaxID=123851 RepID=A0A8K0JYX9_LADFU|nr:hypothetical protein J437_LFUL012701 [Ladona fulva]